MLATSTPLPTIYSGKYKDRNPDILSAGKLSEASSENITQCFTTIERPSSPEVVKKFRATYRSEAGKETIHYGKYNDSELKLAKELRHGIVGGKGYQAADILNPKQKSYHQQRFINKLESIYASNKRAPLGRVVNPIENGSIPQSIDWKNACFGIKNEKIGSAGELLNPNLAPSELETIESIDHEHYLRTHKHFYPGEQLHRQYSGSNFDCNKRFGIATPHSNAGKLTHKAMTWIGEEHASKCTPLVDKRLDDFRERSQPQLGKTLDPIKDTLKVSSNHTFGILSHPDEYGAGDLLHGRVPRHYLRGHDRARGLMQAVRQQLKKFHFQQFDNLNEAFQHYDKTGEGKISSANLHEACVHFGLPIDTELLEQLVDYCDFDKDGFISWREFANFLNWRQPPLPKTAPAAMNQYPLDTELLERQIDRRLDDWSTTNSLYNATIGKKQTKECPTFGLPTIRRDKPIPRFKAVTDRTNYGDEENVGTILQPSLLTQHGVYEVDMMRQRTMAEIESVLENCKLIPPNSNVDLILEEASSIHPKGHYTLEGVRLVVNKNRLQEVFG